MSTKKQDRQAASKYSVVKVEKADPVPDWLHEAEWHRYIIGHGDRRIEGYRVGSLRAVTRHAENVARDLTERALTGRSSYAVSRANKNKVPATRPGKQPA